MRHANPAHHPQPVFEPAEVLRGPQPAARLFPGIGKHHNLMDVGNFVAAMSSAEFVNAHFSQARPFAEKNQIYPWAMAQTVGDGLVLEFGVASGGTLNQIADLHQGPVHGFDVFSGLPEAWRPGFPKGAFAQADLPKVRDNAELVVGLFEDTLPGFVAQHPGRVKLLHVDCDIYSATVTIFQALEDRIDDDTIIVFDEYLNFPGWERDEHRAFTEFCDRTGRVPEYLAFVPASEQVVARAKRAPDARARQRTAVSEPVLRHVRHASLEELAAAGHEVRRFDDGATPLEPASGPSRGCPRNWVVPQAMITPQAAIIKGATLFQEGSFLTADGVFNYDVQSFNLNPWQDRHTRDVLRCYDEATNECLIRPAVRTEHVAGRAVSLLSNITHNYGHFIHDVLARIYYEDLGLMAPGRDIVIAPAFRFSMMRALFEKVFEGYDVIYSEPDTALEVDELVAPVNLCDSNAFNPASVAALAKRLRRALASYHEPGVGHKACVSRADGKQTGGRSFENMDEYEAHMAARGYQVVTGTTLSPEDQFALWANCEEIVGIHGAGMMNMIMMPDEGRYTEITPHPRGPLYTARCAMAAGHDVAGYNAAAGAAAGQSRIDLDALDAMIGVS